MTAACTIVGTGLCTRVDASLRGLARWRALADGALADLGGRRDVPIVIGSCNGAAEDAQSWPRAFAELGAAVPVASGACASGLQALWLAVARLAAGEPEVIVLAVDIRSAASHANFAALRVLDDHPAPWQPHSVGFVHGEAGVALRLVRGDGRAHHNGPAGSARHDGPSLVGPLLGTDLRELVAAMPAADYILGQGTGPAAVDAEELAALPPGVPLATALLAHGHTVGASGLLSVLLAARQQRVEMPDSCASDGRPLGVDGHGRALVACRALGGACAVAWVGGAHATSSPPPVGWIAPQPPPPMRIPLLRRIAELPRPATPPAAIVVRLDAPLVPPADALIGGKLLPSVILEITPGFIAQLLARVWGYRGPSLCVVGGSDAGWLPTLAVIRQVHGDVLVLHVHERDFEWGP